MAYRRCLLQRGKNLIDRRCNPSFTYVLHSDDEGKQQRDHPDSARRISNSFTQTRSFGFGNSLNGSIGVFSSSPSAFAGYNNFCRNMSTTPDQGFDKITELTTDVAHVLSDTAVDAVSSQAAPVVSEVAIAAADSFLPVQVLQYFIDAVHTYTGLNWSVIHSFITSCLCPPGLFTLLLLLCIRWSAIIVTTLLIRTATVPLLINQLKTTSKLTVCSAAALLSHLLLLFIPVSCFHACCIADHEASLGRVKGRDGWEGNAALLHPFIF